jgi:phage gp29-like protein
MAIGYKNKGEKTVKERPNKVTEQIFIAAQQTRGRQIIDDWTKALNAAENPLNPRREQLYKVYKNVIIDADFTAEWETRRKLRVTGAQFNLVNANNEPVEDATKLLENKWFTDLMKHALDSIIYGHSLLMVGDLLSDGSINDVKLINRRHVIPERNLIIKKIGDADGINYKLSPEYSQWLFEFGDSDDLGLLAKVVPYILFSRFALSAWSEYSEKFVMPVRVVKTNSRDVTSLNRLERMLMDMATASYAIIDKDEEFTFLETAKTDGSSVFEKLIATCAAKIAKIINGASIGEASQGGSLAKEEVGQNIQAIVTDSDMKWFEGYMNQFVLPKLIAYGYPFKDLTFKFERSKDLKMLLEIVKTLITEFDIEEKYITDTFGVPVKKKIVPTGNNITAAGSEDFFH